MLSARPHARCRGPHVPALQVTCSGASAQFCRGGTGKEEELISKQQQIAAGGRSKRNRERKLVLLNETVPKGEVRTAYGTQKRGSDHGHGVREPRTAATLAHAKRSRWQSRARCWAKQAYGLPSISYCRVPWRALAGKRGGKDETEEGRRRSGAPSLSVSLSRAGLSRSSARGIKPYLGFSGPESLL